MGRLREWDKDVPFPTQGWAPGVAEVIASGNHGDGGSDLRDPAASGPEWEALKNLIQLCMVWSLNLTFNYVISVIIHVHLMHRFKLI